MIELNTNISTIQPLISYLNKHRENEKFNQAVEISATLLLITFFLIFAIKPTVNAISSLLGEIKSKEALTKDMRSKINKIVEAQDTFSQIQERYLVIESSLPDSPRFAHLISQINSGSSQVGASLTQTNFILGDNRQLEKDDPLSVNPSLRRYAVNHNVNGVYSNLITYIKQLLSNRRLIGIKEISVQSEKSEAQFSNDSPSVDGKVNLNLSTDVYYWSQK